MIKYIQLELVLTSELTIKQEPFNDLRPIQLKINWDYNN